MRYTSLIVLAAAILLGVLAVIGVRGLIASNNSPQAPSVAPAVEGTIIVARVPLEFGTELNQQLLTEISWSSNERPEGSFSSMDEVLNGERRVALRSIAPGELILKDRISGFGGRATLSQIIDDGMRAVTLRVNDVSGAGGFILPGDRVDVLATIQPTDDRIDTLTDILLENVRVLAIDQLADDSQEGAIIAKAATLEVAPEDSQRIALAATIGSLSLSLRNLEADEILVSEVEPNRFRTIGYEDLGPNAIAAPAPVAAPRQARRSPRPRAAKPSPYTTMTITRGVEESEVDVLKDDGSSNDGITVTGLGSDELAGARAEP